MCLSVVWTTYNTWGLMGSCMEGNLHGLMEHAYTYLRYKPVYHPPTYSLQKPHISLSCTVCDKEMWVFVEFTKSFPKIFNTTKRMCMPFGDNPN